jgi:magnesium-transporting ATPase (P-type)
MKKILVTVLIFVAIFSFSTIYAANTVENTKTAAENNVINSETSGKLVELKDKTKKEYEDYVELYGTEAYGVTAYILNKVRIYSIPLCFLGIVVGAIYQYVLGIRKLDVRDKGFGLIVTFVTLLVICQILPLVFAIVVKGWRG